MKKLAFFVLPFAILFIFMAVPVVQAQELEKRNFEQEVANDPQELVVSTPMVVYCWTCGGDYPYNAGIAQTGGSNWVYELGGSCSGGFVWRTDSWPRLCSR